MSEWQVFLIISALVGFLIMVISPILKLNSTLVKLIAVVDTLEKSLDNLSDSNSETHKRIWIKLNDHDNQIRDLRKEK